MGIKQVLVAILVMAVIAAVATGYWYVQAAKMRKSMTEALSRMRSLHMATQQMVLDAATTGDTSLRWPGGGEGTFSRWVANLVPGYLSTNEFLTLMSPPGMTLTSMPTKNDGFVRVYAVTKDSPPDAVLFATANVKVAPDGKISLDPSVEPLGDKGFIIFRKGGDGAVLQKETAHTTNVTGPFPGLLRD